MENSFIPAEVKKIYDCTSIKKNFLSGKHHMAFYVEPASWAYNFNDPVKINTITFDGGYAGKSRYLFNNHIVRIKGKSYTMDARQVYSMNIGKNKFHLFSALEGAIPVFSEDECDENGNYKYEKCRIVYLLDDIYTYNMKFYITGTIGDKPFKASWPASPNGMTITSFKNLNFDHPERVPSEIIIPHKKDLYAYVENEISLCLSCFQTQSRYYARLDYADQPNKPGYFYLQLVFQANVTINTIIYSPERINLITDKDNVPKCCYIQESALECPQINECPSINGGLEDRSSQENECSETVKAVSVCYSQQNKEDGNYDISNVSQAVVKH